MKVFVTGATGFIGSAVVQELLRAGHEVTGLARSEESSEKLKALGAKVLKGSLEDLESLKKGASESGGIIHTGFIHDFSKFKENCEIDRKAIHAMGSVLLGSHRPLIITSGIGLLTSGKLGVETDIPNGSLNPRIASEEAARSLMDRGVHVSIVRLPPSVHGKGDHGFVPFLMNFAREKGISAYVGKGENHWPAVHRFDAATLFKLALEKGAKGACYHGVAEQGIPFKDIAEAIGKKLNLPVKSIDQSEASSHFSWFAHFAAIDVPASSKETRDQLGWKTEGIDLLTDISNSY
jgi:nucleoside-diphosphate-sugar epimerase